MNVVTITVTIAGPPRVVSPSLVVLRCYHQPDPDDETDRDWYTLSLRGGDRWRDHLPRLTIGTTVHIAGRIRHRTYMHRDHGYPVLVCDLIPSSLDY